jgi:hypothetical protein
LRVRLLSKRKKKKVETKKSEKRFSGCRGVESKSRPRVGLDVVLPKCDYWKQGGQIGRFFYFRQFLS